MFVIDFSPHLGKKKYPVRNLRVSPDAGTLAATFGKEGEAEHVVWWSLAVGKSVATTQLRFPNESGTTAEPVFTPDVSKCVVHGKSDVGSLSYHVPILIAPGEQVEEGVQLHFPDVSPDTVLETLAICPEGRWLFAVHSWTLAASPGAGPRLGSGITRWDLSETTDALKFGIFAHNTSDIDLGEYILCLAVSPSHRWNACGLVTGEVVLLDFDSGEQVAELLDSAPADGGNSPVKAMTFSPDGKWLAARAMGFLLTIFNVNREMIAGQVRHPNLTSMAFTPDSKRLLTGGSDKLVRVWDTATWTEVAQYDWKVGPIHSVAISSDGAIAAAGGNKNRVVVWDLDG